MVFRPGKTQDLKGEPIHGLNQTKIYPIEKDASLSSGLLRIPSNLRELREELFECGEMSELTCFKPEPRASPIAQPAR
jgi:hypothetical protein